MINLNFVVMGKTGTGKSTLINSILNEERAVTGVGGAVTKEVHVYSRVMDLSLEGDAPGNYRIVRRKVNLYDTVGLEIDRSITQKTLQDIRGILNNTRISDGEHDITLVWFCLNVSSSRFETYEAELIRNLSVEYEIPFMIVVTQCFSDEKGELEQQIERDFPELPVMRVLAKNYRMRSAEIPAFGVDELVRRSMADFNTRKVHILQEKLDKLRNADKQRISMQKEKGKAIIASYTKRGKEMWRFRLLGIPFIYRICGEMIAELNALFGVKNPKTYSFEKVENIIWGTVAAPFMAVPVFGIVAAIAYIKTIGETYLDALLLTAENSQPDKDIQRVFEELLKRRRRMEEET